MQEDISEEAETKPVTVFLGGKYYDISDIIEDDKGAVINLKSHTLIR